MMNPFEMLRVAQRACEAAKATVSIVTILKLSEVATLYEKTTAAVTQRYPKNVVFLVSSTLYDISSFAALSIGIYFVYTNRHDDDADAERAGWKLGGRGREQGLDRGGPLGGQRRVGGGEAGNEDRRGPELEADDAVMYNGVC